MGADLNQRVDQTLFVTTPDRLGNCVAACAATHLGLRLDQVPHFIEWGAYFQKSTDAPDATDTTHWWAMLVGFFAGRGLGPVLLDYLSEGEPGELLWVMGMSPRGVAHQVLYRDGELWHDPHPSRDGVINIREVLAWRPTTYTDHATEGDA